MWRPLSSQLQSVQALLPTQGMLRADFVGRLCGSDVNLGVLGGALPCQNTAQKFQIGKVMKSSVLEYSSLVHTFSFG